MGLRALRGAPRSGGRPLALAATTLGLCILGIAGAIRLAMRRGAAVSGLGVAFACLAARQVFVLYTGNVSPWQLGGALFGELALLGIALGGLGALHGLQRTTRERDRVEDLHWDSMEAVRVMSELAARPGSSLEERLGSVLELGSHRFGLDLGIAWLGRPDEDEPGRVLAVRGPGVPAEDREAFVAALVPRLRDAGRGVRPLLLLDERARPATFFGCPVASAGTPYGALAFVGLSRAESRFTATDKDLLGLMAQWLAGEIDRRDRVAQAAELDRLARAAAGRSEADAAGPATPQPPASTARRRSFGVRRGVDLNRGLQRLEPRLRQRVGADGTLALRLAPGLPLLARGRLSLIRLVEGLVDAAARLAPTGRIELSTRPPADGAREATLQVCVTGPGVDAGALQRVFDRPADAFDADDAARAVLPLSGIEQLLRADGGDLSVSVEPERRALFTAWLPVAQARAARPDPARAPVRAGDPRA